MPLRYLLCILMALPFAGSAQLSKDSLLQVIAAGKKNEQTVKAYINLASEYLRSDLEKAKAFTYAGLALARTVNTPDYESSFYSLLTTIHTNIANPDSALYYLNLLKALANTYPVADYKKLHSNYYSTTGLFYKKQGNYTKALPYMAKAAQLSEQIGSKEMAAGQYLNIGNTYMQVGNHQKALRYHLQALKLFENIGNRRGISFCYQSISIDFSELKQYDKALAYAQQSLQLKQQLEDKRGIGSAYITLGEVYAGQRRYALALQSFSKALSIAKEMGLKSEEAKIAMGRGRIYIEKNDIESAQQYFSYARELSATTGDSAVLMKAENALLTLQKKGQQAAQQEQLLVSHLQSNIRRGDKNDETDTYKQLAEFYKDNGDFEKAFEYISRHHLQKDSMDNAQVQLEVAQLEGQYKAELKEKQIALLKKDQQLAKAKLQRQQSLQWGGLAFLIFLIVAGVLLFNRYRVLSRTRRQLEMEKIRNGIARDLHDDIGSTLSSIHILSKVLLQQTSSKSTTFAGLQKIGNHAAAMMESIGDIVWAVNPQNDSVEKVIVRMKEFAAELLDPLNIRYEFIEKGNLAATKLDAARRKDLFLIFKEAINNAAKYSRCCKVTIVLENDGQNLKLHVADNGSGFNEAAVKRGNGLHNMQARAGSMRAQMQYRSTEGIGTTVQLAIPSHD